MSTSTLEAPTPPPPGAGGPNRTVVAVLAVLAVVAVAAAVLLGALYWWPVTHGAQADAAVQRDEAVAAATTIVVDINTVRPETLDADLAAAQAQLTDPMLTEYGKVRQRFADGLRQARASVVAAPAGTAMTQFDAERGTASAIVAIDVTASSANTPQTKKQQLFEVEMVRTPDGWKASKAAPSSGQN